MSPEDGWLRGERIVARSPLTGGFRNETVLLQTASDRRYVLRHGNGTCRVEAALAALVADVVPVPRVLGATDDTMLSEFVPGELASRVLDVQPHELGFAIGDTLAKIGMITFPTTGFFAGPDLVPDGTPVCSGLAGFVAKRVTGVLSDRERDVLVAHAEAVQPLLDSVGTTARLVHSDYNPKNLLVSRRDGHWTVSAVLDWEFAFSGHPLVDVGNMLRFQVDDQPPEFGDGFVAGYQAGGGLLPTGWRRAADALDLFALADLVTRGPGSPLFDKVLAMLRSRVDMLGRTR